MSTISQREALLRSTVRLCYTNQLPDISLYAVNKIAVPKTRANITLDMAVKTLQQCSGLIGPLGNQFQMLPFLKLYVWLCPNWAIIIYFKKDMVKTHLPCLVFYQPQSNFHWES